MKKIKILLSAFMLGLTVASCSRQAVKSYNEGINIIPVPQSLVQNNGNFTVNSSTVFVVSADTLKPVADYFIAKINRATGYELPLKKDAASNVVSISVDPALVGKDEAYTLEVTPHGVTVTGKTPAGAFYGMQSFMQLLPAEIESPVKVENMIWSAPAVTVKDEPRFQYRGMHLDVCRHFNNIDFIKKQLDVLAMFKINRFHWHLTDDQLWTVEIKKYPKLTQIGSDRLEGEGTRHKGFYTQEQIKEVVAYANERFIDVIPEVELPGHGLAALTAYPQYSCTGGPFRIRNIWGVEPDVFCAGNEETFAFLEDIFSEIIPLFTSEYIHIGGDECPKDRWEKCPKCQARMRKEGLKNTMELQSYFVQRIEKSLNKMGKKIIGWDEILEGGIAPSATIMSWRGEEGGIEAANAGHDVIMTPGAWLYLDKYQGAPEVEPVTIGGYANLEKTYNYDPIPDKIASDKAHHVIGAQGNVWTEYMYTPELVEYYAYPRILAVAEMTWSKPDRKNYDDFARRINNAYVRLDEHGINYHIPLPEGPVSDYFAFTDTASLAFQNTRNYPMVYTTDGSVPANTSAQYAVPLQFTDNVTLQIATLLPSGKLSPIRKIEITKEVLAPAYTGETEPGILMKRIDGHYLNSEGYKNAKFSEPTVIPYFTKGFDYDKPSVEIYEGYFEVPEDGVYILASDDEELWIDGVKVIDNNNQVKRHKRTKSMKALAKGKHKFTMMMNNSIMGGWPNSWSENTFVFKAPSSEKYTKVTPETLSH